MAKVSLRNLADVRTKDKNLGQTMDDVVTHLTQHKTDIQDLQQWLEKIRKILNI